jgi:predicted ATPase/class 3 adenylate cyclase
VTAVVQPSGTVTLVFTDIEGSTRLLEQLGVEAYREALGEHRRIVRQACARHGGYEVDTEGDAFFYAFQRAQHAVEAIGEAMQGLHGGPIRIRVGIHAGQPTLDPPNYIGLDVHHAARIMSAGHGGQVVLSPTTVAQLEPHTFVVKPLGEHRLKDLSSPIALFQLEIDGLPSDFPPLKTLYRSNLPVPATPFIGRERELAALAERLADPGTRLLTVTGPGGTGKTRLALQAAAEAAEEYPDGITWIPLAPVRDAHVALGAIAQAFGLGEQPGVLLRRSIAESLLGKRALVVMDNLEHLLPEIAEDIASLVTECPTLRVLVTSRERLQISAELTWPVPPMADADAVALFRLRARASGVEDAGDEDVVEELCHRLDSLPLAIELAAARTVLFSPQQLLDRLGERLDLLQGARDADSRQQTLRATVAWSHELLSSEEQALFRRLSVFAGGCGFEGAEYVAGATPDTLTSLLDKSLLRRRDGVSGARYWQLETLRQFGVEQLAACNEQVATRNRHLDWLLALVGENAPEWARAADAARSAALGEERDDVALALSWAIETRDARRALELCARMGRFWVENGQWVTTLAETRKALALGGDDELVADARLTAGLLGLHTGAAGADDDMFAAHSFYEASGDRRMSALASMFRGARIAELGRPREGIEILEASLAELETLGDADGIRIARANLADALRLTAETPEEHRRVAELVEASIELDRAAGDKYDEIAGLAVLSETLMQLGEHERARENALRAADVAHTIGATRMLAHLTLTLADASAATGRAREAATLAAALEPVSRELGQPLSAGDEARLANLRDVLRALPEEVSGAAERGAAMTTTSLMEYLTTLDAQPA